MDLKRTELDLNCDLGEYFDDAGAIQDRMIMPWISACNIACGGHTGSTSTMRQTIRLAQKHGVAIGAHPSYPDKKNFGRMVPDISEKELFSSLMDQMNAFMDILDKHEGVLHHIKPHGALYNQAARDEATANLIVRLMLDHFPEVPLYLPPASVSKVLAEEAGIRVVSEVFADRRYEDDLSLRDRRHPDAVLHDSRLVTAQLEQMVLHGSVITHGGNEIQIHAETVCLHSDTPGSVELAKHIHHQLRDHGIRITAP